MIWYWHSIVEWKDDDKAFIFTLKNPHGVEPTRYMKRQKSRYAIKCDPDYGPVFGADIFINDGCDKENSCSIYNDGSRGYECDPQHKKALFVNTAGPDKRNKFSVVDYEVYSIDNYEEYIYNICMYPDIIWEYVKTKNISEKSLKQLDDDIELLNDLNTIHCENNSIRVKISQYLFKNPSVLLPNTQLINQQYDDKIKEWIGDYQWTLLYRASRHDYMANSFHKYCDKVKGPTLVIIKSSGGWIFGGYTTQSWRGECI